MLDGDHMPNDNDYQDQNVEISQVLVRFRCDWMTLAPSTLRSKNTPSEERCLIMTGTLSHLFQPLLKRQPDRLSRG